MHIQAVNPTPPSLPPSENRSPKPPASVPEGLEAAAPPEYPSSTRLHPTGTAQQARQAQDALHWLFGAVDEALLAFVTQPQPRLLSLAHFASCQLSALNVVELKHLSKVLHDPTAMQDEWNSVQPCAFEAFACALEERIHQHDALTESLTNEAQAAASDTKTTGIRPKRTKKARLAASQSQPVPLLSPDETIARFLGMLPETGNENQRRRAVHRALQQFDTADIGILVSRSNLHVRRFNPLPSGQARQRCLLLVPEVFLRMSDTLGPASALRAKDILQTTEIKADSKSDARAIHFRMTLVCSLYARLHQLHVHRLANGQKSNWSQHGQGLLHFNFQHLITGLGEIPELAIATQDAFCECLLDAGKRLPANPDLKTLWAGSEAIESRTRERARQLVRNKDYLGAAVSTEARFGHLVSTLSIVVAHARLIQKDPLRSQLAARILECFATAMMTELAPFAPRAETANGLQ